MPVTYKLKGYIYNHIIVIIQLLLRGGSTQRIGLGNLGEVGSPFGDLKYELKTKSKQFSGTVACHFG